MAFLVAARFQLYPVYYYAPGPRVGALSDDTRLTSVCHVHRALVENGEA